jgi:hypothetical protein
MKKVTDATKCIIHGCGNKRYSRGLCQGCYSTARSKIKTGETTAAELIRKGLMLEPMKLGRKSLTALGKALAARK